MSRLTKRWWACWVEPGQFPDERVVETESRPPRRFIVPTGLVLATKASVRVPGFLVVREKSRQEETSLVELAGVCRDRAIEIQVPSAELIPPVR